MNKDLKEIAQRSFKLGQINGKVFVIKNYLRNALEISDWNIEESRDYVKDAIKGLDEIAKLSHEL